MAVPRISVILFVKNLRRWIDRAIQSVTRSAASVELLALDAGSTDGTDQIIRSHADRIAYWRSRPDRGPSEAINEGLRHARGEVIGLLAADDWYEPGSLEAVQQAFEADAELDVLSTGVRIVTATTEGLTSQKTFTERERLQFSAANLVRHPLTHARFIKKSIYECVGGYPETYAISNDLDFLLRVCFLLPKTRVIGQVCYTYLGHPQSRTLSGRSEAVLVTSKDNAALAEWHLANTARSAADRRALIELYGRSSARLARDAIQRRQWRKAGAIIKSALAHDPLWPAYLLYWVAQRTGVRLEV